MEIQAVHFDEKQIEKVCDIIVSKYNLENESKNRTYLNIIIAYAVNEMLQVQVIDNLLKPFGAETFPSFVLEKVDLAIILMEGKSIKLISNIKDKSISGEVNGSRKVLLKAILADIFDKSNDDELIDKITIDNLMSLKNNLIIDENTYKSIKGRGKYIPLLGMITSLVICDYDIFFSAFSKTKKYCMMADVFYYAGIISMDEWEVIDDKEKYKCVKEWVKSFEKIDWRKYSTLGLEHIDYSDKFLRWAGLE